MRAGEEESEWEGLNGGGEKRERGVDLAEFLRDGEEGVDSTPSTPGRVFASIDEKV